MVATHEENNLLPQSHGGETDAFEAIIREHQRMIHSLCYRMTGSFADAEDLAQETFVHAYAHLGTFREEARLSSWLYRIAVNQCLNWLKRQERARKLQRAWSEETKVESDDNEFQTRRVTGGRALTQ